MIEDKRRFRRYPFLAIATINRKSNQPFKVATTLINNISYSGIGLSSYAVIDEGTPVSIRMVKIMGTDDNDHITGKVAWTCRYKDFFNMGITFDEELHPDRQPRICRHFFEMINSG